MNVCFPVSLDEGLESAPFGHFGSAPLFLIVDASTGRCSPVANGDRHHAHGRCSPVRALGDAAVDAVVTGGIGAGARTGLAALGIRVYRAAPGTVGENIEQFRKGLLQPFDASSICRGHGNGGSCSHS